MSAVTAILAQLADGTLQLEQAAATFETMTWPQHPPVPVLAFPPDPPGSFAEVANAYAAGQITDAQYAALAAAAAKAMTGAPAAAFRVDEPRDEHGRWTRIGELKAPTALDPHYNEIPETKGISRTKSTYEEGGGTGQAREDQARRGPVREIAAPITAKEARGNSRPVTASQFQELARKGLNQLGVLRFQRSPISGLDRNWAAIKRDAYTEARKSWGGLTVDAHTGKPLATNADKYALSVKKAGQLTVSVPENATRAQFDQAMDRALAQFRGDLEAQQFHLGIFHDDDEHRIDIDPVLVVDTPSEVETIGAYTHAIGGAYHFRTGDGYFPPHVAEPADVAAEADGQPVHWAGPGQWRTNADRTQPRLSPEQDTEIEQAGKPGPAAAWNPDELRDRAGRWAKDTISPLSDRDAHALDEYTTNVDVAPEVTKNGYRQLASSFRLIPPQLRPKLAANISRIHIHGSPELFEIPGEGTVSVDGYYNTETAELTVMASAAGATRAAVHELMHAADRKGHGEGHFSATPQFTALADAIRGSGAVIDVHYQRDPEMFAELAACYAQKAPYVLTDEFSVFPADLRDQLDTYFRAILGPPV